MNRKRLDFDGNETTLTTTGTIIRNFKKNIIFWLEYYIRKSQNMLHAQALYVDKNGQ